MLIMAAPMKVVLAVVDTDVSVVVVDADDDDNDDDVGNLFLLALMLVI